MMIKSPGLFIPVPSFPYIFSGMREYSDIAKRKIQLYFASNYLFEHGKSHPQVVEILSAHEDDQVLLTHVVDQAMKDKWREVFNEAQRLFSENKTYQEVIDRVSPLESDPEIIHFICEKWYVVKMLYADNFVESSTNIWEGIQGVIICTLGAAAVFYFNANIISKILWPVGLVVSMILWLYGLHQKKLAAAVRQIIEEDYAKLDKLV